jgi:nitroimidazol reductase NimA-like FMN-containing flavoprotein (pyridoxamine 5'-phosphate oxidase superfamily)
MDVGDEGVLATVGPVSPYAAVFICVHWNLKLYFYGTKKGAKVERHGLEPREPTSWFMT